MARYASADGNPRLDETVITAADGGLHNERVMQTLLSGIDEATFNNVFAVSLDEMQELATLSDMRRPTFCITSPPGWTASRWLRSRANWKRRGTKSSTGREDRARSRN